MEFKQKITKIGNSFGIILPKELLDNLGIDVGNELFLKLVNNKIILSKGDYQTASPEILRVAEEVLEEYKDVFEELAKK